MLHMIFLIHNHVWEMEIISTKIIFGQKNHTGLKSLCEYQKLRCMDVSDIANTNAIHLCMRWPHLLGRCLHMHMIMEIISTETAFGESDHTGHKPLCEYQNCGVGMYLTEHTDVIYLCMRWPPLVGRCFWLIHLFCMKWYLWCDPSSRWNVPLPWVASVSVMCGPTQSGRVPPFGVGCARAGSLGRLGLGVALTPLEGYITSQFWSSGDVE